MREPNLIAAHMLYDASLVFPKQLQDSIKKKFKATPQTSEMFIEYLSTDAHTGVCGIPESDPQRLWQTDLSSGDITGSLPKAIVDAQATLASIKTAAATCGKLARLCADGFLFLNTIDFDQWSVVNYRFVENISLHITDMPFIWRQISEGQAYTPANPCSNETAAKMTLTEYRQTAVEVANSYLYGNGWPVAKAVAATRYNIATNVLADIVLSVWGK